MFMWAKISQILITISLKFLNCSVIKLLKDNSVIECILCHITCKVLSHFFFLSFFFFFLLEKVKHLNGTVRTISIF